MSARPPEPSGPKDVRLAVVYHVPLLVAPGGQVYEEEGAFARYLEALARATGEVVVLAPTKRVPDPPHAYRLDARNLLLGHLPFFDGPTRFALRLPQIAIAMVRSLPGWDAVNIRVPTPASWLAYLLARIAGKPVFLLVVGDLAAAMTTHTHHDWRTQLLSLYARFDSWVNHTLARHTLTFVNGRDLWGQYRPFTPRLVLVQTSTITADNIKPRADSPIRDRVLRVLSVCRVEPRKGVRSLPPILAALRTQGIEAELTVVGPEIGHAGAEEREAALAGAEKLGVAERFHLLGPKPLHEIEQLYMSHDIFVLASGPGEGVPRVLLEAMAAGLPVVASPAAGIPTLIQHEKTGLLASPADAWAFAGAIRRLVEDDALRRALREAGYRVAAERTVDHQVGAMLAEAAALFRPTRDGKG